MIEEILQERKQTHGSFEHHSKVSQELKRVMYNNFNSKLTDKQMEAIDMILHKLARICVGNPNHKDHWIDIAGYATLAQE